MSCPKTQSGQFSQSRIEGSFGDYIPGFINDHEAAHNVEIVIPKLSEGKVCFFNHFRASVKQCFAVKVFKV